MNEIDFPLDRSLKDEQLQFISDALGASFSIGSVGAGNGSLRIEHDNHAEAEAIRKMAKRFVFISKSMNVDTVFENDAIPNYTDDPQPHLEAKRDVIPVHPGFFTLQGRSNQPFAQRTQATISPLAMSKPTVVPASP